MIFIRLRAFYSFYDFEYHQTRFEHIQVPNISSRFLLIQLSFNDIDANLHNPKSLRNPFETILDLSYILYGFGHFLVNI